MRQVLYIWQPAFGSDSLEVTVHKRHVCVSSLAAFSRHPWLYGRTDLLPHFRCVRRPIEQSAETAGLGRSGREFTCWWSATVQEASWLLLQSLEAVHLLFDSQSSTQYSSRVSWLFGPECNCFHSPYPITLQLHARVQNRVSRGAFYNTACTIARGRSRLYPHLSCRFNLLLNQRFFTPQTMKNNLCSERKQGA